MAPCSADAGEPPPEELQTSSGEPPPDELRTSSSAQLRSSALEEENQRLREELEAMRRLLMCVCMCVCERGSE